MSIPEITKWELREVINEVFEDRVQRELKKVDCKALPEYFKSGGRYADHIQSFERFGEFLKIVKENPS
jgi:hypothetical protein